MLGRSGGLYRMQCLDCCVRLVLSAWPSRARAAGMLAAIERFGYVERSQVLAGVQRALPVFQAPLVRAFQRQVSTPLATRQARSARSSRGRPSGGGR